MWIILLMLLTFNAYSLDRIPLTLVHSDASLQLNLSSPVGVPAISQASVGKVASRAFKSELLNTAIFIIGADNFSRQWLLQHQQQLQDLQAIGFITNVHDFETILALQEKSHLPLLPVNVDPLLKLIHERHYPLVIARGEIWQ